VEANNSRVLRMVKPPFLSGSGEENAVSKDLVSGSYPNTSLRG